MTIRRRLATLVTCVLVSAVRCCDHPLPVSEQPFFVIWNVPTAKCQLHNVLSKWDIVSNTGDPMAGDKIVYFDTPGLVPHFNKFNTAINGGIPQYTSTGPHSNKLEKDVEGMIPNAGFSGPAVINMIWTPFWHENGDGVKEIYRTKSRLLELSFTPHIGYHRAMLRARNRFNAMAKWFADNMLRFPTMLRKKARWGLIGEPRCWGTSCQRTSNDKMDYIFRRSKAIYPTLYSDRGTKIFHHLREALRVTTKYSPANTPIIAYVNIENEANKLYQTNMLEEMIGTPAKIGIEGVALRAPFSFMDHHTCAELQTYIDTVLGPYVKTVSRDASRCSQARCSGRGRCVRNDYVTNFPTRNYGNTRCVQGFRYKEKQPAARTQSFANYSCRCIAGWRGQRCDTRA